MNIAQANVIRAKLGLAPVVVVKKANNQAKNQARRAQESRDLKALRGSSKRK
jgi:hypothetical protein